MISEHFSIDEILSDYNISYNIAPGNPISAVINRENKKFLTAFKWGLIPFWSKDPSIASRLINARSETIKDKPSFRQAFKSKRCLIIASGFFEWEKKGKLKEPVYIYMKDGGPFGFAGIYDRWVSPDGTEINSCSIITTGANEILAPIHDRMPVIIPKISHNIWLDPQGEPGPDIMSLLKPYPTDKMAFHHVSRLVNSPKNNSPDCVAEVKIL